MVEDEELDEEELVRPRECEEWWCSCGVGRSWCGRASAKNRLLWWRKNEPLPNFPGFWDVAEGYDGVAARSFHSEDEIQGISGAETGVWLVVYVPPIVPMFHTRRSFQASHFEHRTGESRGLCECRKHTLKKRCK